MKLHIIGNGGPRPMGKGARYGTCCLLELGEERIMIDCGPGTTYKMARMGMLPSQINTVFLTHHHSDHIVDLPCFALLRFDLDPGNLPPLKVFGPSPTEEFTDQLFGKKGAFRPDIAARREHPISHHGHLQRGGTLPRPGINVEACNIVSGKVVEGPGWRAAAAYVPHVDPYLKSLAYRFDTEKGSVLFLSDAAESPELMELARGVDTFVTGIVRHDFREEDPSHPIHGVSADISEVARIAAAGEVSRIVLIHCPKLGEDFIDTLRRGYGDTAYSGDILHPDELTTLTI
jgi:ribonuclease Z